MPSLTGSFEVRQPTDPCVHPSPSGWDWSPENTKRVNELRRMMSLGNNLSEIQKIKAGSNRTKAWLSRIFPKSRNPSELVDRKEVLTARKNLERSHRRRWRLWNSFDWICWVELVAILLLLTFRAPLWRSFTDHLSWRYQQFPPPEFAVTKPPRVVLVGSGTVYNLNSRLLLVVRHRARQFQITGGLIKVHPSFWDAY